MRTHWLRKYSVIFLIFFIAITLHAPVYHQHVEDHHPDQSAHTHSTDSHHPNDYILASHEKVLIHEVLSDKSHHTHYHAHFEKDLYRINRIATKKVKTVFDVTLLTYNNISIQSPISNNYTYYPYNPNFNRKASAKTSSGLSPPIYSS